MSTDKREYKILIVEDNPGDFALVEDFLFEYIIAPEVLQATSFHEASEILAVNKFDIILLDLSLPDKKGEQLIKAMIEISGETPVIVLTGYTDFSFGVKSLSLGVSDYILKDELTPLSLYKNVIYNIERKKNHSDLQLSEKRYSNLFNLSPLPMWVVDVETRKFLDVNNATLNHYGFSRGEFLSMDLNDIKPGEEMPNMKKGLAEDKLSPDEPSQRVMIHQKKNGELINVEIQIAPVQYKGSNANVAVATDVTERFKYIKAIEEQNEKLKEISWIQSHMVRAPLSRIMGLIPLLAGPCDSTDEMEKMLGYVLLSAHELDEVIKNITDKSRVEDFQNLLNQTKEK
jgi:PAS domain S-box-containing protein